MCIYGYVNVFMFLFYIYISLKLFAWFGLAQSVERSARNHKVPSSIPVLANSAYE